MIHVTTRSEPGDICTIEVRGHAEKPAGDKAEKLEGDQVCAAVSQTLLTLFMLVEGGEWEGDGSGYIKIPVTKEHSRELGFVLFGLSLIPHAYSGHMKIERGEEPEWLKVPELRR